MRERDAARGMRLRIEEHLGMEDVLLAAAREIGRCEVEEVLRLDQHAAALVVEIEKRLEVGEVVGGGKIRRRAEVERHAVALGQREHHLGLERSFEMKMQLRLGHGPQKSVAIHAACSFADARRLRSIGRSRRC